MPLQDYMDYVSVDDHVIEHPNVWLDRLPKRFQEDAPQVIRSTEPMQGIGGEVPVGSEVWRFDGVISPTIALNAVAGRPATEFNKEPTRYSEIRPGCYLPAERVKDMDIDGVAAQLCFPSFAGFAGSRFLTNRNRELALACVQAYNDFIIDEWCAYAPERQIPMAILPLWDPELCAAEIERTAGLGIRALSFPENPVPLGLPGMGDPSWRPVWARAQEAELPLCLHIGTSGGLLTPGPQASWVVMVALMPLNNWMALIDLLLSPVFHEFTDLKVCLSEGGIGWIPAALERADYIWDHHRWHDTGINTDVKPSDLFRGHVYGCALDDQFGIDNRHRIGVDQIMFESDYPHADGKWPYSRKNAAEFLHDVPDEEVHRMIELNARELFHFPRGSDRPRDA